MDVSGKEVEIMKILEGISLRWEMKAGRIATELFGPPPSHRDKLRNGHKISGPIQKLNEDDLIEVVGDSAPNNPASWVLTDKGRNLLEKMKD